MNFDFYFEFQMFYKYISSPGKPVKTRNKCLKKKFERLYFFDTEAFFIKTQRPSLNIQKDENHFALYSKMGFKNKIRKP